MPYTLSSTENFDRGYRILEDIHDNVLVALKDAEVFASTGLGLPHLDQEGLSGVVSTYPSAFVGRQLGDVTISTNSQVGNHRASAHHRIANFAVEVWIIDQFDPSAQVAEEVEKDFLEALIDKMREDPKRNRLAINTEPLSHGGTLETLGSVIVVGMSFAVPYQFKVAQV